jgi:hypothetical protein
MADLNGDDKLDLTVANSGSNTVSVLLGHGDGTFGAASNFVTRYWPVYVAVGDLNGDFKPDLVTGHLSVMVSVLLGHGDGTFGPKTDFEAGTYPISLAIGDVDGDQTPDLVAANQDTWTISVLAGHGDGTFGARTAFGTGKQPYSVALGDVNGDLRLDLAAANYESNTVTVLLNMTVDPAAVEPGGRPGFARLLVPQPNPFRSTSAIGFDCAASEPVTLEIFDLSGRLARTLSLGVTFPAGRHSLRWDGRDETGRPVAGGIYFVRLRTGEQRDTQKILRLN